MSAAGITETVDGILGQWTLAGGTVCPRALTHSGTRESTKEATVFGSQAIEVAIGLVFVVLYFLQPYGRQSEPLQGLYPGPAEAP